MFFSERTFFNLIGSLSERIALSLFLTRTFVIIVEADKIYNVMFFVKRFLVIKI